MYRKSKKTNWWALYLILPFGAALLWFEHQAPMAGLGHGLALIAILGTMYGLIWFWCQANSDALTDDEAKLDDLAHVAVQSVPPGAVAPGTTQTSTGPTSGYIPAAEGRVGATAVAVSGTK